MIKLAAFLVVVSFTANAQMTMGLSKGDSQLIWEGRTLVGTGHEGTIQFVKGMLTLDDNIITGGEFVLDMNSIRDTDLKKAEYAKDLEDHLKSEDFFSVDKFPNAFFVIQKITPSLTFLNQNQYNVTGRLTIKGISHQVSFVATIVDGPDGIKAEAKFSIDRTKWDVIHQSKSIFADLKDGIISDQVDISLNLRFGGC